MRAVRVEMGGGSRVGIKRCIGREEDVGARAHRERLTDDDNLDFG
jgi:hypothetical protein